MLTQEKINLQIGTLVHDKHSGYGLIVRDDRGDNYESWQTKFTGGEWWWIDEGMIDSVDSDGLIHIDLAQSSCRQKKN